MDRVSVLNARQQTLQQLPLDTAVQRSADAITALEATSGYVSKYEYEYEHIDKYVHICISILISIYSSIHLSIPQSVYIHMGTCSYLHI